METKKERVYSKKEQLAIFFLIGLFLPLTVLLFLVPGSWYQVEGYEDLGVVEFVAVESKNHNKKHYVYYEAADGSGLGFWEKVLTSMEARRIAEAGERVRRHVYLACEKPGLVLSLVRNAGQLFLEEGEEEHLQRKLDGARKISLLARGVGLCYIGAYAGVTLYRRKRRRAQN
ncbi:hypothetical protein AALA82_14040 [Oscillospiraceae bacterium 50-16]|nr:hypothetical protein [Lawsonibacter sp.]